MVTITSGPADGSFPVDGQTVGQVRTDYGKLLNVAPGARATVNGIAVDDAYRLQADDELDFSAAVAEKGA